MSVVEAVLIYFNIRYWASYFTCQHRNLKTYFNSELSLRRQSSVDDEPGDSEEMPDDEDFDPEDGGQEEGKL